MKKLLTAVLVFLLCQTVAMAVPAQPGRKILKKADGTQVAVTLKGDEFMHYYLTDDGKPMRLVDGFLQDILTDEFIQLQQTAQQRMEVSRQRRAAKVKRHAEYKGSKKGLVILVQFSDNEFTVPEPQKTFDDFFNKEGYADYGMKGSVSDYFKAQSYGQFSLNFDVVGPYRLTRTMKHYGQSVGDAHDQDAQGMVEEAVKLANKDVNYRDYDWDQDGHVDQVFVIYAGRGENYAGNSSDCIWPHESTIANKDVMLDGIRIGTYACSCELNGTTGKQIDGIGAACHEFSHCLGIMDHYDTSGDNYGMGSWDLMCSGSYNNNSSCPAAYTAYERWVSGWLEPVEVNDLKEVKGMKPIVESPEAYILYNDGNKNEYYLLENRQRVGFDEGLSGHGLLVVHVDYNESSWRGNSINVGDHQRMTIVAADNEYGYSYVSVQGDPFPGSKKVTSLTDYSTPAAVTYNKNKDKSNLLHKPIDGITEDAKGLISMLLCAAPVQTPVLAAPTDVTSTSFRLSWGAVEGADKYELLLDGNSKRGALEESVILDEDFKSCYSKSASFTDISKEISKYLPRFQGSKLFTTPDYLRIGTGTAAGYLYSPVFDGGKTGDLTIVIKVKPYKEGTAVKGTVKITTNTPATNQSFDFNFTTSTTLVFHSTVKVHEIFRVDIAPGSAMYLNGLAIYDGDFSEEELGLNASANKAPHRVTVKELTTTETSYLFTDLDPNTEYKVKIRAWQGERYSEWSEEMPIELPTAILQPVADGVRGESDAYFDLQGRVVSVPSRGVYIHNGKKVVRR